MILLYIMNDNIKFNYEITHLKAMLNDAVQNYQHLFLSSYKIV